MMYVYFVQLTVTQYKKSILPKKKASFQEKLKI